MRLYDRVTVLHDDPDHNMLGTVVGTASYCVDDRDFTTMDGVGTIRQMFVVALDYKHQGWLGGETFTDYDGYTGNSGGTHISHILVHEDNLEPAPWFVNVYEEDRGYGGPEEGGWYYDISEPVHSEVCETRFDAEAAAERLREDYPEQGDRPVSSVLYNGGAYTIRIENHPPVAQPETVPHYS